MAQSMTQQPEFNEGAIKEIQDAYLDASFTINAEAANSITVNVAVKTNRGQTAVASRPR